MILKKLTVNNFRCYRQQNTLEFSTDSKRNVTVVHGVNGAGKTSLFLALNWVLYGDKVEYAGHLVNEAAMLAAGKKPVEASASLEFEHDNKHYHLSRGMRGYRDNGNVHEEESGIELYVIDETGNSRPETKFYEQVISGILPAPIRTFFFFDGDKISEFTRPGKQRDQEITRAVNDVLKLDLLTRAATHLGQISRQIETDIAAKGSPQVKQLREQIALKEKELDQLNVKKTSIFDELSAVQERRNGIDREFAQIAEIAEKAKKRAELEGKRKMVTARIEGLQRDLMKENIGAFYLPASDKLSTAKKLLDDKRRKGEVPSNYKDQFLRDLLEQRACICTRPIESGSKEEAHIKQLLAETLPGSLQDRATLLGSTITKLLSDGKSKREELLKTITNIDTETEHREKIESEIEALGADIASNLVTKVTTLEKQRQDCDAETGRLTIDRTRCLDQITLREKEIADLRNQFDKEAHKETALKELTKQVNTADSARAAFVRIKDTLVSELRDELAKETTKIFTELTWKKDYFKEVTIGEHYLIGLLSHDGYDLRPVMSMGETQILSLSFILAMTAISGNKAPLVIDTPLARLSTDVRDNLLRELPGLTQQLVLFVTDTELTSHERGIIANKIGKEYHLNFDGDEAALQEGA